MGAIDGMGPAHKSYVSPLCGVPESKRAKPFVAGNIFSPEFMRWQRAESAQRFTAVFDFDDTLARRRPPEPTIVFPYALEKLTELNNAGVKLVLWSEGSRALVVEGLKEAHLFEPFDVVICTEAYYGARYRSARSGDRQDDKGKRVDPYDVRDELFRRAIRQENLPGWTGFPLNQNLLVKLPIMPMAAKPATALGYHVIVDDYRGDPLVPNLKPRYLGDCTPADLQKGEIRFTEIVKTILEMRTEWLRSLHGC